MPHLSDPVRARTGARRAGSHALLAVLLAIIAAGGDWTPCLAQSDLQVAEYKVKAAFLYKFASFVEWPPQAFEQPGSPLVIGVIGADALGEELVHIVAGRSVGGRPVVVRSLGGGGTLDGLHILFVGRSTGIRVREALASAKGKPTLSVSESEDAFALGSIVNFVIVDDKVRFDVSLREAELANLKISSRLLSVARKVLAGPS